ncbi:MAG: hypothetical protein Ta2B_08370 [Termitinemataceae bacterium]|nr:MAG: hypothetical protein Ta2B_08370 [Termitinemataceae bacterium]
MTEAMIARQELHDFIDILPEQGIAAIKPLFSFLAEQYEPVTIETDLTDEEHALIADSVKRYHEHPETFVTLDSILQANT